MAKQATQTPSKTPSKTVANKVHSIIELFDDATLTVPSLINIMLNDDIKIGNVVSSAKRLDYLFASADDKKLKDEEQKNMFNLTCKVLKQYVIEVDKDKTQAQLEQIESMIDAEVVQWHEANERAGLDKKNIMPSLSANKSSKLGELLRTYVRKCGQVGRSMSVFRKYLQSLGYNTQTQAGETYRYMIEDTALKILKNLDSIVVNETTISINGKELAFSFFSCPELVGGASSGSNSGLISETDTMFAD